MEDRLRFEKFVADISATFVNVPSERLDESIAHSLTELVALLGNDRCTVVRLTEDPKRILVTHSVAAAGVEAFPVGPMPDDQLPWYIGQFRRGKTVFLQRLPADLPPEADKERQVLQDARHPLERRHPAQGGRRGPGRHHLRILAAALRLARRNHRPPAIDWRGVY